MTSRKSKLLAGSLFTTLLLTAGAAAAQTPGSTTTPPKPAAAPAANVEELVVTGSRIRRNEFTSEAPLTVITSESATLQGLVDTATLLQTQPIASGSFQVNGLLTGFVTDGGPGASTISLRGLGATRTLVLLDGRRLGPAGVRGSVGPVDLNVVPSSIIDRTEILKDGASSIYGSDAIAGVVNFITKKRLDGGEVSVYTSQPFDTGGEQYEVNGSWGKTFERGYLTVSGEFNQQKVLRIQDREYLNCREDYRTDPATFQRLDYTDPTTGEFKCYNVLTNSFQAATVYGGVFQYDRPGNTPATATTGNNIQAVSPALAALGFVRAARAGQPATFPYANYDSPLYGRRSAVSPFKRYTLYAGGGYDLTPGIEVYGDLLLNRRESEQYRYQQLFPTVAGGTATNRLGGNPNNPFVDVTGLRIGLIPIVAFQSDGKQQVDYVRGVGGVKGKLGELPLFGGWDWDIFAQYSKSKADYYGDFVYNDRLNAVIGNSACNPALITLSNNLPGAACLPGGIPFASSRFLAGNFTPQESAFLFGRSHGTTEYTQAAIEGTITGELFTLPAGPLSAALGFAVRHEKIDDTPDVQETAQNMYNLSSATPTRGDDTVSEVFAEATAPVFRDLGHFGDLEVTGSARYTDYKSYGSSTTYRVGFNWQAMPAVRVRGTLGTSFRAPALYELYIGDQTSFANQTAVDPCIRYENSADDLIQKNCASVGIAPGFPGSGSSATVTTGGGAGRLKAEESKAATVGVIFTPHFDTFDLSLSVDYFEINIDDEVRQFGAGNIVKQCYASRNFPNDPLCGLFTRNSATDPSDPSSIRTINDSYVNVASQQNRGIDLDLRYKQEFPIGTFTVDGRFTWQLEDTTQLLGESEPEDTNGSTTEPDFSGQTQVRYDRGDWTGFWQMDINGKASDSDQFVRGFTDVRNSTKYNRIVRDKQFTEFMVYHTVSVRKKMDKWTAQVGIRNLFDEAPPALSAIETFRIGYSALNAYDLLGRRAFVQIDRRF